MNKLLAITSIVLLWSLPVFAQTVTQQSVSLPVSITNGGTGNSVGQAVSVYGQLNIQSAVYGAKQDAIYLTDVTTTNTQAPICSASYSFKLSDEQKWIAVKSAGNSGGTVSLVEQITGLSAGGAGNCATGATNASRTISGTATAAFGTDDSVAIQAAINAGAALGGAQVVSPNKSVVTVPLKMATGVSVAGFGPHVSAFYAMSSSDWPNHGIFYQDASVTYSNATFDNMFQYFECDGEFMNDATYVVNAKCIDMPFTQRSWVDHLYVHDTPATGIATDFGNPTFVTNNQISGPGRLTGTNGGGNCIGEGTDGGESERFVIMGNSCINPHNDGILLETQNSGVNTTCMATIVGNIITQSTSAGTHAAGIVDAGCSGMVITDNRIEGFSGIANWSGIGISTGTFSSPQPGVGGLIANNTITGTVDGVWLDQTGLTGNIQSKYTIKDNHILASSGYGIRLSPNSSFLMNTVEVSGNQVAQSGNAGLGVLAGAGGVSNLIVNGNTFLNNGATTATDALKSGISIAAPVSNLTMYGNTAFDNLSSKQLYALTVSAAVTGAAIGPDNFQNNATQAIKIESGGSIAGQIYQVAGYNPVGTTANVTLGASPATYTCGTSQCFAYLNGGAITSVTVNGVTLGGLASGGLVTLASNESMIVSYTVVPTLNVDIN